MATARAAVNEQSATHRPDARAWPNLRRAASILKVNPSSLSRRGELLWTAFGSEHRLSPGQVLSLADYYGRRPIREVAFDLLRTAESQADGEIIDAVEWEIEAYFQARDEPSTDGMPWLAQAQAALPPAAFNEVMSIVERERPPHPGLQGDRPAD
jgi:hypothetical protein